MDIVPALLESDAKQFADRLNRLAGFVSRVQIDFNDGSFGGFVSLKMVDIARLADKIFFEAHLMVQRPYDYVPKLLESGVKKIIVQYEIESNIREVLEQLKLENILIGLAIGPETAVANIEPLEDLIDSVTILGVEPGEQGQKLITETLEKVQQLHESNFGGEIQFDGGISAETIDQVVQAGPDTLVVGSYIVGSDDPKSRYDELVSRIVR